MGASVDYTASERVAFALSLIKWRKAVRMTRKALAAQLGITTQTVRNLESGRSMGMGMVLKVERFKMAYAIQESEMRRERQQRQIEAIG